MQKRLLLLLFLILCFTVLAAGCWPGGERFSPEQPAGFFWGIWHGWIAPISLIWSIFNPELRIYEPFNTGWWYDFAFYMAIISGFGGISLTRRKWS